MSIDIKRGEEVWTSDGDRLGTVRRLHHRQEEINPELELYATYLHVVSFDLGDDFYVPTDYIDGRDKNGRILLTESMQKIQDRTWTRLPDFVAQGKDKEEELPAE